MKASELYAIIKAQNFCCALTGQELSPQTASIDHIHPLSGGGKHTVGNLQWVHKDLNRAKGSMGNDEFIAMCRAVARWADTKEQGQGGESVAA